MKKLFFIACCSLFLFSGCGKSYFQSADMIESDHESHSEIEVVEPLLPEVIYVQVAGAVANPDVYELPADSRVYTAIEAAGGLLDNACTDDINQAAMLEDGQKIYVYTVEEVQAINEKQALLEEENDGLVNINSADITILCTLPGIGQAKASQIIAYRQKNGSFSSIEEIKNVSGIGDGIFNQISSLIKI